RILHFDLVILHQRIREQPLAELPEAGGGVSLELDQPADPDLAHPVEAERRKGAFNRLSLRVEDAVLGAEQDPGLHRTSVPARSPYPAASSAGPSSRRANSSPHCGSSAANGSSSSRTLRRAQSRTAAGASRPSTR